MRKSALITHGVPLLFCLLLLSPFASQSSHTETVAQPANNRPAVALDSAKA